MKRKLSITLLVTLLILCTFSSVYSVLANTINRSNIILSPSNTNQKYYISIEGQEKSLLVIEYDNETTSDTEIPSTNIIEIQCGHCSHTWSGEYDTEIEAIEDALANGWILICPECKE